MKTKSPRDPKNRMMLVAGAWAIDTWGAAEFVKKWWDQLKLNSEDDFAAILDIRYEKRDIKWVKVNRCKNLSAQWD